MTRSISSEFIRFVITGVINTAASYIIYLLLLVVLSYSAAYTISYAAGIALAYYLNSRFVFGQPLHWKKAAGFPLIYGVQYLLGIAILVLMVEAFRINTAIAPLIVIACTVPFTFVVNRAFLKGKIGV